MRNNYIQTKITKIQRIIKYFIIGIVVIIALHYIPDQRLNMKENIMIGALSSMTFAILDMIAPTIKIHIQNPNNYAKANINANANTSINSNLVLEG
jgi:hypothetical protein